MLGLGVLVLAGGPAAGVMAATYPVDDSASLPGQATIKMRPPMPTPGQRAGHMVDGGSMVTVVLNTAPWIHRLGRIYMVLPQQPIGPVSVNWTTQGRLLPGALVSGQRALVYAGPITANRISDTIVVSIQADGRRLASPQRLDFKFEIDVE